MNLRGLDRKLKRSFQAYKSDMDSVKSSVSKLSDDIHDIKSVVETLKDSSITKDKINLIKIKIGELNDQLKKTWALEEEFKELETRTVSKEFFNQQFDTLNDEFDDLKASMVMLNKETISEIQVKELIDDLNDEFNKIRNSIEEIRSIKDTITQKELEKRTNKLNSKIESFREEYKKFEDKSRSFSTKQQLEDMQKEFSRVSDEMKKGIETNRKGIAQRVSEKKVAGYDKSIKELKSLLKAKVNESEIHGLVGDINKEFESVKKELSKIGTVSKDKVDRKSIEDIKSELKKIGAELKQTIGSKDVKIFVDENKKLKKDLDKFKDDVNNNLEEEFESMEKFFEGEIGRIKQKISSFESKDFREIKKNSITKKEFEANSQSIRNTLETMSRRIDSINKESATKRNLDDEKKAIYANFNIINHNIRQMKSQYARNSDVEKLKEYLERIERKSGLGNAKLIKFDKPIRTERIKDIAPRMEKVMKAKKENILVKKKMSNAGYTIGNILVGLAFVLLAASIALFFFDSITWMNRLAAGAVVSFIIGIIIRISIINKERKGVE